MGVSAGDSWAARNVRDVGSRLSDRRPGRSRLDRELAGFIALWQDFDGKVRAEALAQAAADAVSSFDDGVVGQDEAVLGTDLYADVAAFAPLVDPADVDVVDDGGLAMRATFGCVERCRGWTPRFRINRRDAGP
jgi:hypothetical protein